MNKNMNHKNITRKEETVGSYINRAVVTMSPEQNLFQACQLMRQNRIGCVIIADNGKPAGIITESTVVKQVASGRSLQTKLDEVMTRRIISVRPDENISDALELMHRQHIRRLPVMQSNRMLGVVTQTDLLEASCRLVNTFKNRQSHLSEIASRDELTGLYNRRYFKESFQSELERTRAYGGLLALVLLDIDHFKNVNDTCGHSAGDKVLQQIAAIIRDNSRPIDIVARYGGEEFAVLLPGLGTRAAYLFAERLRNIVAKNPFDTGDKTINLTISGGVCKWTKESDSSQTMIDEADKHLYQAKNSGRNKIEVSV
jgi:diguanylate cyclase (GGDEF)-like protein